MVLGIHIGSCDKKIDKVGDKVSGGWRELLIGGKAKMQEFAGSAETFTGLRF
jgi:hypothetical protein